MEIIKPKQLQQGDTIAVMAPSSRYMHADKLPQIATWLESQGYNARITEQCAAHDNQSAGTVVEKCDTFHDLMRDPSVKAIWMLRGGYQSMRMLPKMDMDVVRANPKIIMGYSDSTALLMGLHHHTGLVTFHGPMAFDVLADDTAKHDNAAAAFVFLSGQSSDDLLDAQPVHTLVSGTSEGVLTGGNLSLVSAMALSLGMDYFNDTILFIEEVGEDIEKMDRTLCGFQQAGLFDRINGLVVGHMTSIGDTGGSAGHFGLSLDDVLRRYADNVPVVTGAHFGHAQPNRVMPVGARARLDTPKNGKPTLSLLESPFASL